jgi:hypothetical protein
VEVEQQDDLGACGRHTLNFVGPFKRLAFSITLSGAIMIIAKLP